MKIKRIGIIGGGPAGIMAAVLLARQGFSVTIMERNDKIGKKLLVTGNGRCNISNRYANSSNYFSRSQNIAGEILKRFPVKKALEFFASMGISVKELENGKLYPYSLEAKTVVKAFLYEMEYLGVEIIYNALVEKIEFNQKWQIHYEQKSPFSKENQTTNNKNKSKKQDSFQRIKQKRSFDQVILCTGGISYSVSGSDGKGYEIAKKLGHHLIEPIPAIVQLVMKTKDFPYYKHLQGTKTEAQIQLYAGKKKEKLLRSETGELLFTAYGVSGPPILSLSSAVAYALNQPLSLRVNFFPEMNSLEFEEFFKKKIKQVPYFSIEHLLEMFLPNRLVGVLLKQTEVNKDTLSGDLTEKQKKQIIRFLTELSLDIDKPYQWQQAQVTAGGVDCRQVYANSLESTKAKGLYFAGEILDIDGDCGGYNLQWAWSSAMTVAESIGKYNQ